MKFDKTLISTVFVTLLGMIPFSANASLIGDTVSCGIEPSANNFWACSSPTAIVGNGVEFQLSLTGGDRFNVDLEANSVSLTYIFGTGLGLGAGELLTLSDLDWINDPNGVISGVLLDTVSGVTGVEQADFSFTDHSIAFDMNGTSVWNDGDFVTFNFTTTDNAVPAPATLALFGLGLAGLGWSRRKKA